MSKRVYLSRDEILGLDDLPVEDLWVPEWNTWIRIRAMDALTAQRYADLLSDGAEDSVYVKMATFSAVDEQGELLFTTADLEALGRKNFAAVKRVAQAGMRLSGIGKVQQEAAVEAAEANFTGDPGGGSVTD